MKLGRAPTTWRICMQFQCNGELYRVLFNRNAGLTGLGGNERSILFRQGHNVRRMREGAVEGIGKGGGKGGGEQIDVDLQVPAGIDTVNGKGAAATVGRTQEIEGNGPDRGATQRLRNAGLVPMKRVPVTTRGGRLDGLQAGVLAGMQFQLQFKAIEIVA